jgi:HEPN domain-containing protein
MKGLTAEWLAKAEEDYSVAAGLLRRRKVPADSICFHSQQAAEKFLKAVLQEQGIHFGKTHDLEGLLRLCTTAVPQLTLLVADAQLLNDYAVRYRYPGIDATRKQASLAVKAAGRVRRTVLPLL